MQTTHTEPNLVNEWQAQFFEQSPAFRAQFESVEGYVAHMLAARFSQSAKLNGEFSSVENYCAYMTGQSGKRSRNEGRSPVDLSKVRSELARLGVAV